VKAGLASVAGFGAVAPPPYTGKQFGSGRVDYRYSDKTRSHPLSHDGNRNQRPLRRRHSYASIEPRFEQELGDQYLPGRDQRHQPQSGNDLRFSYQYWQNGTIPAPCNGDINGFCAGAGGPEVFYLNSVNFSLGNNLTRRRAAICAASHYRIT